MTTDTEFTTVRLPHTGTWVPDRALTVTAYRELPTSSGVAYTANLRLNKKPAGVIENGGRGGMTYFTPRDWRTFGDTQLDEYAARCRTEEGEPVTTEALLDALIEEHDWTRKTAAATRRGRMMLRLMNHTTGGDGLPVDGFPPHPHADSTSAVMRTPKQWDRLTAEVLSLMPAGPHGWWQAYDGACWRDVTPRPKGVLATLYG